MRKLLFVGLIIALCLPITVYAASIGGIETQGKGKVAVGLEQELVFDRDLKFDKANWDITGITVGKAELDKLNRTMAKVSYGLLDNLDIYVKLGVADFKADVNYSDPWPGKGVYDGKNALAYGFGMKGVYDLENDWLIGADVQYLRHRHDWSPKGYISGEGDKATIQEWHVATSVGYRMGDFLPYLGVKYSDLRAKAVWGGMEAGQYEKYKAADNIGVFVGTDYKLGESWKLNLEARFIDETAMSFGATYRF